MELANPSIVTILKLFPTEIKANLTLMDQIECSMATRELAHTMSIRKTTVVAVRLKISDGHAFLTLFKSYSPDDSLVISIYERAPENVILETRHFELSGTIIRLKCERIDDDFHIYDINVASSACRLLAHLFHLFVIQHVQLDINSAFFQDIHQQLSQIRALTSVSDLRVRRTEAAFLNDHLREEHLRSFMERLVIANALEIQTCPEHDVRRIAYISTFRISRARWFTMNHLRMLQCSTISLLKSGLSRENLLEIVDLWRDGNFVNLQVFSARLFGDQYPEEIVGSVPYEGGSYYLSDQNLVKKVSESRTIVRNDGIQAIVLTQKRGRPRKTFRMLVLNGNPNRYPTIIGILVGKANQEQRTVQLCENHLDDGSMTLDLPYRIHNIDAVRVLFAWTQLYHMLHERDENERRCQVCGRNRLNTIRQMEKWLRALFQTFHELEGQEGVAISFEPIYDQFD